MTEFNDRRPGPKQHTARIEPMSQGGVRGICNDCGWDASTYDASASPDKNRATLSRTMRSHRNAAMKADEKAAAKAAKK